MTMYGRDPIIDVYEADGCLVIAEHQVRTGPKISNAQVFGPYHGKLKGCLKCMEVYITAKGHECDFPR